VVIVGHDPGLEELTARLTLERQAEATTRRLERLMSIRQDAEPATMSESITTFRNAPGLGNVALSRHAQQRMAHDGISEVYVLQTLSTSIS
jgi:hypothetical protein